MNFRYLTSWASVKEMSLKFGNEKYLRNRIFKAKLYPNHRKKLFKRFRPLHCNGQAKWTGFEKIETTPIMLCQILPHDSLCWAQNCKKNPCSPLSMDFSSPRNYSGNDRSFAHIHFRKLAFFLTLTMCIKLSDFNLLLPHFFVRGFLNFCLPWLRISEGSQKSVGFVI